jgi:phosphoribosyl 1,2-cyclic phosphodiesterase
MFKVKLYGTRGSIPVCDSNYQKYGGNTTCLFIQTDNFTGILDAGTGIRNLGKDLMNCNYQSCKHIYMAFSHFHWDHIQGFPFFAPAYDKNVKITFAAISKEASSIELERILSFQMKQEYFPVPMGNMGAIFHFMKIDKEELHKEEIEIRAIRHNHPGNAYSYRIDYKGKSAVFCTDIEHANGIDNNLVELARNTDILIHDAQFTPEEYLLHKGWGHSSYEHAIEVFIKSNAKKLILTHHDPDHNDEFLSELEDKLTKQQQNLLLARDGMEFNLLD